jgi:glycosyltransferase involved in cell wall biosynthesis
MRILYLHQYFSTSEGAAGTRSYEFAKQSIASGHSVTMICGSTTNSVSGLSEPFFNGMRRGFVDGIEVIEININYSNYYSFFRRSIKFLKFVFKTISIVSAHTKYDLIYATSTPLTIAIPGILAKLIYKKAFILEVRDLWPDLPKAMGVIKNPILLTMIRLLERVAYRFADAGVGLSPGICDGMSKFNSLTEDNITLIPNGCDIEFFQKSYKKSKYKINSSLTKLLSTKFTCIFCGAHGIANGLDAALDAAKILQEKGIGKVGFIFIGDGKMKPSLINRAKKERLYNCHFFDPIPKKALISVLKRAGLGMMLLKNIPAFYHGTSPNKFFDYIAAGLPVFNNYPGWIAELIQEFKCGVVAPPDSPEAFADIIINFIKLTKEQRAQFSYNALRLARERFDRGNLSKSFVRLCEEVYQKSIV